MKPWISWFDCTEYGLGKRAGIVLGADPATGITLSWAYGLALTGLRRGVQITREQGRWKVRVWKMPDGLK